MIIERNLGLVEKLVGKNEVVNQGYAVLALSAFVIAAGVFLYLILQKRKGSQ